MNTLKCVEVDPKNVLKGDEVYVVGFAVSETITKEELHELLCLALHENNEEALSALRNHLSNIFM